MQWLNVTVFAEDDAEFQFFMREGDAPRTAETEVLSSCMVCIGEGRAVVPYVAEMYEVMY